MLGAELGEQQLGVDRPDQLAQRLRAGRDDLVRALHLDLAGEAVEQRAQLLLDERLERLAVAQGVVDGEAERLVVAAGAEAADGLDDLHVVRAVAAAGGGQHADLAQPREHVAGDVVALADLLRGHAARAAALLRAGERALDDAVLDSISARTRSGSS